MIAHNVYDKVNLRSPISLCSQRLKPTMLEICLRAHNLNRGEHIYTMIAYGIQMTRKVTDHQNDLFGTISAYGVWITMQASYY